MRQSVIGKTGRKLEEISEGSLELIIQHGLYGNRHSVWKKILLADNPGTKIQKDCKMELNSVSMPGVCKTENNRLF